VVQVAAGSPLTDPAIERFRESSIVGLSRSGVNELTVASDGRERYAVERVDGRWWLRAPLRVPAQGRGVDRLLDALDAAEIVRFLDDVEPSDAAFGLEPTAKRVLTIGSSDGERVVRIGARSGIDDERYVRRDDRPPVLVSRGLELDRIPVQWMKLAARELTGVNRYRVRAFAYRVGDRTVSAEKSGDGWVSNGETIAEEQVFAFLVDALGAGVSGWEAGEHPGGEPHAELHWTLEDGDEGTARFWNDGAGVAVVDSVDGAIATLAEPPPSLPRFGS
jgi:hypothetical protein